LKTSENVHLKRTFSDF